MNEMATDELLKEPDNVTESPYGEIIKKVSDYFNECIIMCILKNKQPTAAAAAAASGSGLVSNYFYDVSEIREARKQQQREQERLSRQFGECVADLFGIAGFMLSDRFFFATG